VHTFNGLRVFAHRFAFSPPVPASGSASGFLPASALARHETLRPHGGEDARCVQSTSATHTTCVHPYLVRSWLAPQLSPRGRRAESTAPHHLPGKRTFHDVPYASADRRWTRNSLDLLRGEESAGVFFPRCLSAIEPLTPLSRPALPSPSRTFVRACPRVRRSATRARWENLANRRGHRDHPLVKEDGS